MKILKALHWSNFFIFLFGELADLGNVQAQFVHSPKQWLIQSVGSDVYEIKQKVRNMYGSGFFKADSQNYQHKIRFWTSEGAYPSERLCQ